MGKTHEVIDAAMAEWIVRQHVFFVATAPRSDDGHVNCSPKSAATLRVLAPREIAYVDELGSGIESISHLRENGRMVIMLCAFEGPPRILRLHGTGKVVAPSDAGFAALLARFDGFRTARAILRLAVTRIADSCGYGVPLMEFRALRNDTQNYVRKSSDAALRNYLVRHNQRSIDGLRAMSADELERAVIDRH